MKWHEWLRYPYRILLEGVLMVLAVVMLTTFGGYLSQNETLLELVVGLFMLSLVGLYLDLWRRSP